MGEEVSVEEEEVEGNDEEWDSERAKVERESSGTDTSRAEEVDKTVVEGISEAIAAGILRFAKRSKTRSFSKLVPGSPAVKNY